MSIADAKRFNKYSGAPNYIDGEYQKLNCESDLSLSEIDDLGGMLYEEYNYRKSGILEHNFDIKSFIESMGGRVLYPGNKIDWTYGGSLFYHGSDSNEFGIFEIIFSQYTANMNNRFVMAHDFGHVLLHCSENDIPVWAERYGHNKKKMEIQAHYFAAGLLMPRKKFIEAHDSGKCLGSLAVMFGVSQEVVSVRKDVLGLGCAHNEEKDRISRLANV